MQLFDEKKVFFPFLWLLLVFECDTLFIPVSEKNQKDKMKITTAVSKFNKRFVWHTYHVFSRFVIHRKKTFFAVKFGICKSTTLEIDWCMVYLAKRVYYFDHHMNTHTHLLPIILLKLFIYQNFVIKNEKHETSPLPPQKKKTLKTFRRKKNYLKKLLVLYLLLLLLGSMIVEKRNKGINFKINHVFWCMSHITMKKEVN